MPRRYAIINIAPASAVHIASRFLFTMLGLLYLLFFRRNAFGYYPIMLKSGIARYVNPKLKRIAIDGESKGNIPPFSVQHAPSPPQHLFLTSSPAPHPAHRLST